MPNIDAVPMTEAGELCVNLAFEPSGFHLEAFGSGSRSAPELLTVAGIDPS
jgi:hypothetical protein